MAKTPPASKRRWLPGKATLTKLFLFMMVLVGAFMVWLDVIVRDRFDGKRWAMPAHVFAKPVQIYEGAALNEAHFRRTMAGLSYQAVKSISGPGQFAMANGRWQVSTRGFDFSDGDEAPVTASFSMNGGKVIGLQAEHSVVRLEPELIGGFYADEREERILMRLDDAPDYLYNGLVAVEDRRFYDHYGVSIKGIARAFVANVKAGQATQGGSTITQQLVKNFWFSNERRYVRKAVEAMMALLVELHYSKQDILETYMNEIYLGQAGQNAVHGFAMGARHFFGKDVSQLSLAEAAMMIGIVKGPSYYDPWRNAERALKRRDLVLDVMAKEGVVTLAAAEQAKLDQVKLVKRQSKVHRQRYPHFVSLVRRQLLNDYREQDLQTEGLRIFSTLSPEAQYQAEQAVVQGIKNLEKRYGESKLQAAAVVTDPSSGELNALVSDREPDYAGFNRAIDARRPIGSLFKPVVYLAALDQSQNYTLATMLQDQPVEIETDQGEVWSPKNYDKKSLGDMLLFDSLVQSRNQSTARLGLELGTEQIAYMAKRLGVTGRIPLEPSMVLGTLERSPLDVAQFYQTIAAEGFFTPIRAIKAVTTANNEPLQRYGLEVEERISPHSIFLLRHAMIAVMKEGTGKASNYLLPKGLQSAGKTGTTNDQRDSWFAGFTGDQLAVVWVGKDDNQATKISGSAGALRLWSALMAKLSVRPVDHFVPDDVVLDYVDTRTGLRLQDYCQGSIELPFYAQGMVPDYARGCDSAQAEPQWRRRLREIFGDPTR